MSPAQTLRDTGIESDLEHALDATTKLMASLHGPKMDGPRNETERLVLEIDGLLTNTINTLRARLDALERLS